MSRRDNTLVQRECRARHIAADPEGYRAKHAQKQRDRTLRNKVAKIAYKGGACMDCGAEYLHPACFDLHHRDPSTKIPGVISSMKSLDEKVYAELDKCDLLCSNCHKTRHATGNL